MYRDSLYSNVSTSSRMGGGSWVCINGELYHFGRPGMQWGKHLPWTDWWKETMERNKTNGSSNLGAAFRTAKLAFNINKGKLKDAVGYEAGKVASGAKRVANRANRSVMNNSVMNRANLKTQERFTRNYMANEKLGSVPMTHLQSYMRAQLDKGHETYESLVKNPTFTGMLNLAISNAKFGVASGVDKLLKKMGLSEKVDNLISRITGKDSGLVTARKDYEKRRADKQAKEQSRIDKEATRDAELRAQELAREKEERRKDALYRANKATKANNDRRANTVMTYTTQPRRSITLTSNNASGLYKKNKK